MGARRGPRGSHRATALAAACLLLAGPVPAAVAAPDDPAPVGPLAALEDEADGALAVTRDTAGQVVAVASADGEAVVATTAASPAAAAQEVLAEHGTLVGVDGAASRARVERVLPAAGGGSVVRAQQVVGGLPVLGGVVVTVLDAERDLVSLSGDTARGGPVGAPDATDVGPEVAASVARREVARRHDLPADGLRARDLGPWLYDPAVLGIDDPAGPRAVRRVEVTGPTGASRAGGTVLVDLGTGEVALTLDDTPGATRVCDREQRLSDDVERCEAPPREGPADQSGPADVEAAHEHLGETVATYADLGVDLPALLGGPPTATVGWCDAASCRADAFWDPVLGQAFFGPGMPLADDVVAHELTHGWVRATAGLLYVQQSGAVDESVADLLGEVVDQRHGTDDDGAWTLGEDAPGFAARSMADPAADGRPDRMTSPSWVDEHATHGIDAGGVHTNLGVGDKTAHLVSQGGTFNGRTVVGIDAGDPTLARTATLWVQAVPQLTPGADYADLGRVLVETCARLAADGVAGFDADACVSVREAVAATELATAPVVGRQPVTVPVACPTGTTAVTVLRDDDPDLVARDTPRASSFGLVGSQDDDGVATAWPVQGEYAVSGRASWALADRTPGQSRASVTSDAFRVPTSAAGSFLGFAHAEVLQVGADGSPVTGGRLQVERLLDGAWTEVTDLPWRNGPVDEVAHSAQPVFAGDSRGWGSSQVDLTALRGQQVRLTWSVDAPPTAGVGGAPYGWWLDDVRLTTCARPLTTTPASAQAAVTGTGATLVWQPPTSQAGEVAGYRVTRSDTGAVVELPATARQAPVTGLTGKTDVDLRVAAVGPDGRAGPAAAVRLEATSASVTAPTSVRRGARFTVSTRVVELGTATAVPGVTATLQRLPAGTRTWATVARATTSRTGTASWSLTQRAATSYRVVVTGLRRHQGTTSPARNVRLR